MEAQPYRHSRDKRKKRDQPREPHCLDRRRLTLQRHDRHGIELKSPSRPSVEMVSEAASLFSVLGLESRSGTLMLRDVQQQAEFGSPS